MDSKSKEYQCRNPPCQWQSNNYSGHTRHAKKYPYRRDVGTYPRRVSTPPLPSLANDDGCDNTTTYYDSYHGISGQHIPAATESTEQAAHLVSALKMIDLEYAPQLDSGMSREPITNNFDKMKSTPSCSSGSRSRTESVKTVTFEQETGLRAGNPILRPTGSKDDAGVHTRATDNPFHPFQNETDYAWAQWLSSIGASKGDIGRFYGDKRLAPMWAKHSFNSGDKMREKLSSLPAGIIEEEWNERIISIESDVIGKQPHQLKVQWRSIESMIRFFLGHTPFAANLTYAPVREFNSDGNRIYSELHTANWWWRTQEVLGKDNATIVPVMLASDKTLLTRSHGSKTAWPMYLTIGNLDKATRRQTTRPSAILLGFIPVLPKSVSHAIAMQCYHESVAIMLQPLELLARKGMVVKCADGYYRQCYPIIAGFMVDYPEQTLITGVKNGRHCPICQVPPDERGIIHGKTWPFRTHQKTVDQIMRQQNERMDPAYYEWVHPINSFAWRHPYFDVHGGMMADTLHQLLKGVFERVVGWVCTFLAEDITKSRARPGKKNDARELQDTDGQVQLDFRFKSVPQFPGVKIFGRGYHDVVQWTGDEMRGLAKQVVPVVAPLLSGRAPLIMLFLRAVVDFLFVAQYYSHDDLTLEYLDHYLNVMEICKDGVRIARRAADLGSSTSARKRQKGKKTKDVPADPAGEDDIQFNIPKLHMLVHYCHLIREHGSTDGTTTNSPERLHHTLVKTFFLLTNFQSDFSEQILRHNSRQLNYIATEDVFNHATIKKTPAVELALNVNLNSLARPVNHDYDALVNDSRDREVLSSNRLPLSGFYRADRVGEWAGVEEFFIPALAVFIREHRLGLSNPLLACNIRVDRLEKDDHWAGRVFLQIHTSMQYFIDDGTTPDRPEARSSKRARCAPNWDNEVSIWRRDYVWLQEYLPGANGPSGKERPFQGKIIGQLMLLFTVADTSHPDCTSRGERYSGALVKVLEPHNNGVLDSITGMAEFRVKRDSVAATRRTLGSYKIYSFASISRGAHMIPVNDEGERFYLNHYSDFEAFNTIYDDQFLVNQIRVARREMKRAEARR